MMCDELPEGFRIITVSFGGSGRGDELFAPALQRWGIRTSRRGLFRRRTEAIGWNTVEVGNPFGLGSEIKTALIATAHALLRSGA